MAGYGSRTSFVSCHLDNSRSLLITGLLHEENKWWTFETNINAMKYNGWLMVYQHLWD